MPEFKLSRTVFYQFATVDIKQVRTLDYLPDGYTFDAGESDTSEYWVYILDAQGKPVTFAYSGSYTEVFEQVRKKWDRLQRGEQVIKPKYWKPFTRDDSASWKYKGDPNFRFQINSENELFAYHYAHEHSSYTPKITLEAWQELTALVTEFIKNKDQE